MPVPTAPQLYATLGFTLPPSRMDHDESIYLTWKEGRSKPLERVRIPVSNLRGELDRPEEERVNPKEQLGKRGFAVFKHESGSLASIGTEEGTAKYLDETASLLKDILGCDKVIAWNSVVRKNTTDVKEKIVTKQEGPEKGFVPTSRVQPTAGLAHVDQNAEWGLELCGKAIGRPAGEFKRVQIINLWRPLHGPVTNAPLFMLDPTTLSPTDIGTHASQYGSGLDIHHSSPSSQRWAYVRHQMPDEAILLKCYDSDQGKRGEVLWCAHGAGEVEDDGIEGQEERPRESVEVRLVAVWE
ncbi:hypothetical protein IAR50_001695 [Cryptococcus sp. DSM 104548]